MYQANKPETNPNAPAVFFRETPADALSSANEKYDAANRVYVI